VTQIFECDVRQHNCKLIDIPCLHRPIFHCYVTFYNKSMCLMQKRKQKMNKYGRSDEMEQKTKRLPPDTSSNYLPHRRHLDRITKDRYGSLLQDLQHILLQCLLFLQSISASCSVQCAQIATIRTSVTTDRMLSVALAVYLVSSVCLALTSPAESEASASAILPIISKPGMMCASETCE
jgi:hypothetical protein